MWKKCSKTANRRRHSNPEQNVLTFEDKLLSLPTHERMSEKANKTAWIIKIEEYNNHVVLFHRISRTPTCFSPCNKIYTTEGLHNS